MGVKHALVILDLIGKIVLNDPVYCRMCWSPMFSLLRRFPRQLQLQNFIVRFCKVALKQLLQNELRASAVGDVDSTVVAPPPQEEPPLDNDSENLLRQVFYKVDVNNNNFITKNNLLQFMQRAYTPLHEACDQFPRLQPLLKPATYAATFQKFTTNDEGRVTFDEFSKFAASLSSRQSSRQNSRQSSNGNAAAPCPVDLHIEKHSKRKEESYNRLQERLASRNPLYEEDTKNETFENRYSSSTTDRSVDFANEYEAELSSIQGKRVMIMSVLGRLVSLRNSDVNGSILVRTNEWSSQCI